ncbi:subtilisin-like serine protease-like protein [Bimuria novae-zelandiae CBS 107.79]|uniref:Subtilisin-like serine protease-like protein n=1 Tax=Bimuria novae-zelandiae CBS 107.79 TaxID=1447943 RepID=A0A6A5VS93_9PLEO|nr:subtilisin-like serine protease-like protein [Bimuria novae-zelandiae CBS 107.79]
MKFSQAVAALAIGARSVSSASLYARATNDTITGEVVPNVYIVEFNDDITASTFYGLLAADGVYVKHRMDLNFRFFKGASFQINPSNASSSGNSSDLVSYIKAKTEIRSIWPVRSSKLEMPETRLPLDPANSPSQHVKRQNQDKKPFSPHVMTQIDKLHAEGVTGKGVQVAIIDSGIDYTHPALGGCFGENCLVKTGYDFVGDNFRLGVTEPEPDNDPLDTCFGHGTHVAGTVAAQLQETKYGFSGGAPGVRLAAYRIWNCISSTTDEIQLAAFGRAVEDGADIISYSNGFQRGWAGNVLAVVASRIADSGIQFAISEGNDGGRGLFYSSSPATGFDVTGVGAVSNTKFPILLPRGSYSTGNSTSTSFGVLMGEPAFSSEVKLTLWSAVGANNACTPLPNGTDLSESIVLLQFLDARATRCYPPDQASNIAAKGGRYMLYYDGSGSNLTMRDDPIVYADGIKGVARIAPYVAEQWLSLLKRGSTITVNIPSSNNTEVGFEELDNNETGGFLANSLTSWGPSWELGVKPNLVSPGENILSTYLTDDGGYRVMTGTSMAAPLVASAFALLKEVRGSLDPQRLRRILTTTSKPIVWHDGTKVHPDILAPVPQQGSGVIQVWNAAHTTAELSIDSIAWNDTDHFVGNRTFSVLNTGTEEAVFELSHRKAVTMYTLQESYGVLRPGIFPNPIVEDWADIRFSSSKITVPAGESVDVTVTCTPPASANGTLLPVYSGYISINNLSSNNTLVLPYLGVAGSMRSASVTQPSLVYLANYNNPISVNTSYTIPRPDPANPPPTDSGDQSVQPNLYMELLVGSALVHIDVLRGEEDLGSLAGSPQVYLPRGYARVFFNGLLADGTVLEEGSYSLRVRALRIFGDEAMQEDWDVVKTVEFSFKYAS